MSLFCLFQITYAFQQQNRDLVEQMLRDEDVTEALARRVNDLHARLAAAESLAGGDDDDEDGENGADMDEEDFRKLSEELDQVDALMDAINSQADALGDKLRAFLQESQQERLAIEARGVMEEITSTNQQPSQEDKSGASQADDQ